MDQEKSLGLAKLKQFDQKTNLGQSQGQNPGFLQPKPGPVLSKRQVAIKIPKKVYNNQQTRLKAIKAIWNIPR